MMPEEVYRRSEKSWSPDALHPDYQDLSTWWLAGWDFYRGGIHVQRPQGWKGEQYFLSPPNPGMAPVSVTDTLGQTQAGGNRRIQLCDYVPIETPYYLWSHERELYEHYRDRAMRLYHLAVFGPVVDSHADAVMRVSPSRDEETGERTGNSGWQSIYDDADGRGTSWNSMVRDALAWACVNGRVATLVEVPALDNEPATVADEQDMGARPYLRHLTALDILDWSMDPSGRLRWIKYREPMADKRNPGQKQGDIKYKYHCISREDYVTWYKPDDARKTGWMETVIPHNVGRVPVAILNAESVPDRSWRTQGVFPCIQAGDRVLLNLLSLYHDVLYGQTFSTLWLPDPEGNGLTGIMLGIHNALSGPQKPEFVSADASQAGVLLEAIKHHVLWLRQMAYGRGEAEGSLEARSQPVLQSESEQKRVLMARLAGASESYENDLHSLVSMRSSLGTPSRVTYGRNFDLKSLQSKLSEATQLKGLEPGNEVLVEAKIILAQQLLRELGAQPEKVSAVREAAEKHLEEAKKTIAPLVSAPVPGEDDDDEEGGKMSPDDGANIRDGQVMR